MKNYRRIAGLLIFVLLASQGFGQLRLPSLISDGMVLQRDCDIKIWGWDLGGQKITIDFMDKLYETVTNDSGRWSVNVPNMPAGGPYALKVNGSSQITVHDVMVGEVWLCSGQSNMETTMGRVSPLYPQDIANAQNENIRYFAAPQSYNFNKPLEEYTGGRWQKPDPKTVLNFSAIAFFYARELNKLYNVPIGMINTAIGGTPIEAWISEEAIKAFPEHYKEAQRFKDKALIESIEKANGERYQTWSKELAQKDEGHKNPGMKWTSPDLDASGWTEMNIPGYWSDSPIGKVNGAVWFRKEIVLPASMAGKPAKLLMGTIVDSDSIFVNGHFVGTTGYMYPPRRYDVPAGMLREGKNTLVVKVISNGGRGGFVPDKPYELIAGSEKIDLKGIWKCRVGASMKPMPGGGITVKYKPVGLYNAMIAPLLNYRIKGVLWYQGESNANRAMEYRQLFPVLVKDWRTNFGQGEFPFLYVQLPNFMESRPEPSESDWALMRESQLLAGSVPNTAMVVTIDVGEWNDIHPLNKLDVAKRLVLAARKTAYGEDIVYSGPVYQSMKIKKNKIILTFNHTGSGLVVRGNQPLKEFAIAGADKKFHWAEAKIKKNTVIVTAANVSAPVAVRYAWADNPAGANLMNKEELPASPFRTDTW
jgi:sialate O-acetylesterase